MTQPPPQPAEPVDPYTPIDYPDIPASYMPPPVSGPGYYPGTYGAPYADPYDPYRQPVAPSGTNGLAIGSLATSIVGALLTLLCCVGGVVPIAGIVFGIVALIQINKTHQDGRGMAIAGIVIGALALVATVVVFVLAMAFGNPDYSSY